MAHFPPRTTADRRCNRAMAHFPPRTTSDQRCDRAMAHFRRAGTGGERREASPTVTPGVPGCHDRGNPQPSIGAAMSEVRESGESNPPDTSHSGEEPRGAGVGSRLNWLRAGVLGANDGIVSTAGVVVGFASATSDKGAIVLAGIAALSAG